MTYRVTNCLACDSEDLSFRDAIIAPFVASRISGDAPSVCRIAQCRQCGFGFFEDRFDEQEATKLYAGYRGEQYFKARHYWEPWYTRKFNAKLGGKAEMKLRRQIYRDTIEGQTRSKDIHSVLDYGGDRGQLMVGGHGREFSVFDISGVESEVGINAVTSDDLLGRTFDLVLLCEVLEHVSDPKRVLHEAANLVKPGGFLYVTVPNQEFPMSDIPAGGWYRRYLRLLLKSRIAILAFDFWSTGFRTKFRRIPALAFVKMHEHVNFFNKESLMDMVNNAGLRVLTCQISMNSRGLVALSMRKPNV